MESDSSSTRLIAGLAAAAALAYFLYSVGDVLLPFFFAVVVAYLVNPLIVFFEERGWRRDRLVLGFYLGSAAILFLAAQILIPLLLEFAASREAMIAQYQQQLQKLPLLLQKLALKELPFGGEQVAAAIRAGEPRVIAFAQSLPGLILLRLPVLLEFALIPFVAFFALVQGPAAIQSFVRLCPNRHVEKVLSLISKIDEALGNYLRGLFLEALAVGTATLVGLLYLRIPFAWQIAMVTGVTNIVPYLGPICGGVLGAFVAFYEFHTVAAAVQVLVLVACVRLLDDWVFQPVIMQRAVEIHPVLAAFALLVGGSLFGFLGLLFAVPCVCILKEAARVAYDWYIAEAGLKQTSLSRYALRIPYL